MKIWDFLVEIKCQVANCIIFIGIKCKKNTCKNMCVNNYINLSTRNSWKKPLKINLSTKLSTLSTGFPVDEKSGWFRQDKTCVLLIF